MLGYLFPNKAGDENRTRDNSLEGCSFTTKLHPLNNKMARDGIEPPTHGASIHCSTNWATEPYCGSRIWTYDLRVMSPTSYRAAPSRVNFKKEDVGFEPTHAFTRLTVFKTVPFSRTWVILQQIVRTGFEPVLPPWKGGVLTPWPTDLEPFNSFYYTYFSPFVKNFFSVNLIFYFR